MISNYFKIAVRNILRHKVYSFINIVGLAVGMACTILILLWVQYELSFDLHHEKADRIFRLITYGAVGKMKGGYAVSNYIAGKTLTKDYSEVERSARFQKIPFKILIQYNDKQYFEDNIFLADDTVFDIFTFPLIKGDPLVALKSAFSIVITEDMAQKYFGDEDPIGSVIKADNKHEYTVTGVMKNIPPNSHFIFNALVSFETLRYVHENYRKEMEEDWLVHDNYTYLLLRKAYDHRILEKKFPAFIEKYVGETLKVLGAKVEYFLQPLTQIHLNSKLGHDMDNGKMVYVYAFSIIAIFVLFIACINFMNLSTARSASRAKEVGVRKALGAYRSTLAQQFFCETFLLSFVSFVISFGLVEIALPFFRSLTGSELSFDYIIMPRLILGYLGLVSFVAFVAGSYPAFFLSAYQPIKALTGKLKTGVTGIRIRSILVTFQFTISIGLIIGSVISFSQLSYMKQKRLGFNKEQIVVIRIVDDSHRKMIPTIKDESFDLQYRADEKLDLIFSNFSLLAILVACLGLFGLASFTAEQRTKEIGIRKALGATISSIVILLIKEFTKWVLLANIIAWPIAYVAMNHWLQNFAYRIDIGLGPFILAGVLALAIALLTVGYQAIRAAKANPVKALRYE